MILEQHRSIAEAAAQIHAQRGLEYDGKPYSFHLYQAYNVLLPLFGEYNDIMQGALCHDLLEDTGMTYNDLVKMSDVETADIVYDVTNELGKNRKERAERTYPKIAANVRAVIVKVGDRFVNMLYSRDSGSSMFKKYKQEYPTFREKLYNPAHFVEFPQLETLWAMLDEIAN